MHHSEGFHDEENKNTLKAYGFKQSVIHLNIAKRT